MARAGIASDGFCEVDASFMRAATQRRLDAAMLVTEGNLQVEDPFAVAIEAEMTRFDDPGMYRTHRDLVYFRAFDLKKRDVLDRGAVGKPHRFEPGMTFRKNTVLFVELALEVMRRRAMRR